MIDFEGVLTLELTVVLATGAFAYFLYFFNKLLHAKSTTRELLPFFGITMLFLSFGIAFFITSWYGYYIGEYGWVIFVLFQIYSMSITGGLTALFFIFEYVLKRTKYVITIYLSIMIIIQLFTQTADQTNFIIYILIGPFVIIGPIMWYIIFIRPTSGYLKRRMILAFIGLFLMGFCLIFRGGFLEGFLGKVIFPIATGVGILGGFLVGYGFSAFSTFSDLNWKDKLRELFVISPKGICLYAFSFDQKAELGESDLIAGGFTGIQMLLSELVKTDQPMQLIEYQEVKILVEHYHDINFILLNKEESTFLQFKLRLFAKEFHEMFKEVLRYWVGEVGIFSPTKALIRRIFEIEPSQNE